MNGFDYVSTIAEYKELRENNKEVFSQLNKLRKKLRFLSDFNDNTKESIIKDLYSSYSDLEDISEILGVSECETFYLMVSCEEEKEG